MSQKNINDIKMEKITAGKNAYIQVLISHDEAPNFAMRRFVIKPGGSMPLHTNLVEHEQYVLNGCAEVGIENEVFLANKNDVLFIPPMAPHYYKVVGDEPYEFLCMIPNKTDKIELVKE